MAVTDGINCAHTTNPGTLTFGDIRARVFSALGFVDPSLVSNPRDLESLRSQLYRMLGYASMGGVYPPDMRELLADWINSAQQQLWRRMGGQGAAPAPLVADDDLAVVDGESILGVAIYLAKLHAGEPDAKAWGDLSERNTRYPPGAKPAIDAHIRSANELIYRRYDALHVERYFSWQLQAGVGLYALSANAEGQGVNPQSDKILDPYKIRSVRYRSDAGGWQNLAHGIPSHAQEAMLGRPSHFDVRDCIRVWPVPEATEGSLVVSGHWGPDAFIDDDDYPSVDGELVYLLATANAKSQFGQQDAQLYVQQFESHLGRLVAGAHGVARYLPGFREADFVYSIPRPEVPFP